MFEKPQLGSHIKDSLWGTCVSPMAKKKKSLFVRPFKDLTFTDMEIWDQLGG